MDGRRSRARREELTGTYFDLFLQRQRQLVYNEYFDSFQMSVADFHALLVRGNSALGQQSTLVMAFDQWFVEHPEGGVYAQAAGELL